MIVDWRLLERSGNTDSSGTIEGKNSQSKIANSNAMEMAVYFEKIVRNFSRYNKYTLGSELRKKSREIVALIIKANSAREKLPLLHELRVRLEEHKVLIRISKEAQAFKCITSFQHAIEGFWPVYYSCW